MFFNYVDLESLGYKVLGLHTRSKSTCYNYIKYFDSNNSLVIYGQDDSIKVFFLEVSEYADFKEGNFTISDNIRDYIYKSNDAAGYPCRYKKSKIFNSSYRSFKRRKTFEACLKEAEEYASNNILVRDKLIQL